MRSNQSKTDRSPAAEAPSLPGGILRFIWNCLSRFKIWIVLMLFFELGQATGNILVPYAIKKIMDGVAHPVSEESLWANLEKPLLFLAALNLSEILFSRASGAVLITMGPRLRQHTAQSLYAYLQYHSPRFFSEHFAGALAHRITETAVSLNHTLWAVLCDFWPILITFGTSVALLFDVHRDLGLFVAGWVVIYVLISYWLATRCQPYAQNYAAMRSLVNGKIVDGVTNVMNAKLFARLDYERRYLKKFMESEVNTARNTFRYMERVRWFQFTAAAALKIGTVYYALVLWDKGVIGVGDFTMSTGLALLIIGDARNLSRRFLEFFEYLAISPTAWIRS